MFTLTEAIQWITDNWNTLSEKQKKYLCKMLTEREDNKTYIFEGQVSVEDCLNQKEAGRNWDEDYIDSTDLEILENFFEGDGI